MTAKIEVGFPPVQKVLEVVMRDWLTTAMCLYLAVAVTLAMLASFVAPYDPYQLDIINSFAGPSMAHWMGTDDFGRDVLSRLLHGAQISFTASFLSVGFAVAMALPLGLAAGYYRGWIDSLLMRLLDIQLAMPGLVFVIAIASALGGGLTNAMIALSFAFVPVLARVTRAGAMAVREETYIEASKSIGTSTTRILFTRVLRNVAPALLVQTTITMGLAMSAETGLSFLGLGAQPPEASWGAILRQAYDNIFVNPYGILAPAILITITAWSFNTIGEAIGEVLGVRRSVARRGFQALTNVSRPAAPSSPTNPDRLLDVRNFSTGLALATGHRRLVDDISFGIDRGRVLGIVGESGSGKSVTAMSVARLFPSPPGTISSGSASLGGKDLLAMDFPELRKLRGKAFSLIFQNPKASLNPAFTIGYQIGEVLRWHAGFTGSTVRAEAMRLLEQVGVPGKRVDDYPHQLSGGMCQRVMIAMALAGNPALLIADEPTSALDVTVQAEILDLLHDLKRNGLTIALITHDFGVVADICDDVLVLYAGEVVERGPTSEVLARPAHPYTRALLKARPSDGLKPREKLASIEGQVPVAGAAIPGCRFADRCEYAIDACSRGSVPLDAWVREGRVARCIRIDELTLERQPINQGAEDSHAERV